jgi:hypothetical protein
MKGYQKVVLPTPKTLLQVIAGILIIVEQKMIGQGSSFVKSRSGVILNTLILIILFLVIILNAYFGFGVSGLD